MPGLVRNSEEGDEFQVEGKLKKYDTLTIGEIMELAVDGGPDLRKRLLKLEEKGKKRKEVIDILRVNWNS
jgi:hypothetical protein